MKAIVLVGGFGTRLRPLTREMPKQMLPVVDRPMIEWVLEPLGRHGVTEAVLSLGYRPDAFTDRYTDGTCAGVALRYAVEPEPLDTAGAVGFAARTAAIDERFLVLNGDVLTDLDLTALVDVHQSTGAEGTIHLTPVEDPSRYGVVPIDPEGRVIEFIEKPPSGEAPTNWINAGTYVLEPTVLDRIPADEPRSIERTTFPEMAAEGCLFAWQSDVYWIDTGTPATYIQAQLDLTDGVRGTTVPAVAADAVVDASAEIERSVVMAGATVAADTRVVGSVVLPRARVGAGSQVTDSVIGPGAVVGDGARLAGWTVIGAGAVVDGGARLTGARVPEEGA